MIGKKSEAKSRTIITLLAMSFAAIFLLSFAAAPSILTLTLADFNQGTYINVSSNLSGAVKFLRELPNNQQDESPYNGINMTGNVLLYHFNNQSAYGESNTKFVDFSGFGNNGSCSGGGCPTLSLSGRFDRAYSFDGGDQISVPYQLIPDGSPAYTLCNWFNTPTSTYPAGYAGFIGLKAFTSTRNGVVSGIKNGGVAYIDTWGTQWNPYSGFQINTWYYVCLTSDTTYQYYYVNGNFINSRSETSNFGPGNAVIGEGKWESRYFNGLIDEVSVWNRTLSSTEVSKMYNFSSATRGNYQSKVYDMNGSVYWKNLSWAEGAPYGEELPSNNFDEKAANIPGGTNMSSNLLLYHLNNDSKFGENNDLIYDFSRYGNNGSCNSGAGYCPNLNSSGKFNGAYSFDGSNDYIWSANFVPDTLIGDHNPFTITAWHYPKDNTYNGRYIFGGSASGNDRFLIYHSVDGYKFTYGYGDWYIEGVGTAAIQNAWNHIAFEYNGSHIKIYHNGIEVYNAIYTGNGDLPNTGMPIGCVEQSANSCLAAHYKGLMDEFAVWNRTLTADEIANLYKRGANNLKFQARSCDDAACSGENWSGPFGTTAELPNNKQDERILNSRGTNMTKNVLLMHFNNDGNYGENSTFVYDFSGLGNNGIFLNYPNNATYNSSGKFGGAYNFDGINDCIDVANENQFDFNWNNTLTVSFWVKSLFNAGWIISKMTGAPWTGWLIYNEGRDPGEMNLNFGIEAHYNFAGQRIIAYTDKDVHTLADGNFHHIVATYSGSGSWTGVKLYIDGAMETLKVIGGYETDTVNSLNDINLNIGGNLINAVFFNGNLDEVAIFNRSLSAEEVYDLYNREANNYFTNSTLSNISTVTNTNNRYFQYKAVFETDSNTSLLVPELFNITFNSNDGPPIVTLSPSNAAISTAALNCSIESSTQLSYITLYSNVTGTWQANQTVTLIGNINSTIFNMNLNEGSYKWNCQANNSVGSAFAPSNNTFFLDYSPKINFTYPTPGNATTVQSIQINTSLTESYLQEFKWNWNGTNYTIYNDSLVLMMNFENKSSLGENSSHFRDLSKYGNDGNCNFSLGYCPTYIPGKFGGAYKFNSNYIRVPFINLSKPFSAALWVNTSCGGDYGLISQFKSGYSGWMIWGNGGEYRFYMNGGTKASTLCSLGWHYVSVVWDGTNANIYYDGVLKQSNLYSTAPNIGSSDLIFGAYYPSGDDNGGLPQWLFQGSIDEVRIYNRSLSAAEINQSYRSNLQKYNLTDWNFYSNQSSLVNGNYTYYAYARDLNSSNQTETKYLTLDTTTPMISFSAGTEANDTAFNNRDWIYVNVSAVVSSEANSTFIIYNSSWSNVTYNTTPQQRTLNWTNLGQGIYYYNVSITTTAEITGSTETRKVILDSTVPFINFTTPTDNDGAHVARSNTYINTSIFDDNLASAFIDFNRSLVGYWSFNWEAMNSSHVFDNSTYGNNGTINGATWNSNGKHGGAMSFSGLATSTPNIDIPLSNSLNTTSLTVSAWIYLKNVFSEQSFVCARNWVHYGWCLSTYSPDYNDLWWYIGNGSAGSSAIAPDVLDTGKWIHILATYNGTTQRLYVNSALKDEEIVSYVINYSTVQSLRIGNRVFSGFTPLNGMIDEVMIFSRALSAEEINATFNAGSYRLERNFTGLADTTYTYQAWIVDRAGNTNKTETRSVVIDTTAPTVSNITVKSNDTAEPDDVDSGDKVNITANITDALTGVDAVKLQYKYHTSSSYINATMSNTTFNRSIYNATFIPTIAGNWTYRIWTNDSLGNEIYSSATNVSADLESTWTRAPTSFGTVSGFLSITKAIGNITINNTGDYALSFNLISNSPYDLTFSDNSFTLVQKESKIIEVTATFGPVTREYDVRITIDAVEAFADPSLTTTNFSLASYAGGPYFDVGIDVYPVIMNHSQVYNISGYVENIGNETGTGTSLDWTLPTGFTASSGNITWSIGNITAGSTKRSTLNISAPATVSPGAYTFYLYSICEQCNDSGICGNTSYYINDSQSKTTSLACSKISDGTCGDGCTYETDASNYDPDCTAPAAVTIQSGGGGSMGGGGAAAITSEATFELVRGKDEGFSLEIKNPYSDAKLTNLKVSVEGYLAQYVTIEYPKDIAPGSSATLTIKIAAPAYFTKGIHNLTFIVDSIKEKGLIKESWSEKRYVTLAVHEISKLDSQKLLNESSSFIESMKTANLGVKTVSKLLLLSQSALESNDYEEIQRINNMIKQILQSAFDASNLISEIASKIASSEYMGVNTPETSRLLELAKVAAEREDYALAFERAKEAELTYAVETKGEYNIGYFIARNSTEVFIGTLIALCLLFVLYLRVKLTLVNIGLKESREEEDVLLGLMKETQKETFVEGKRSMEEYNESMIQYENRLSKAVQRAIELETIRANLFRFKGEKKRLEQERERLLNLMRETQAKYLQGGMIESRIYQNKMHSFSSRLSEIEEKLALREAERALKRGKKIVS